MRFTLLLIPLILAGCTPAKIQEAYQQQRLVSQGYSSRIIKPESTQPVDIETLLTEGAEADKKKRNADQSTLLAKSEVNCNYFVESIHNQRAAQNITFGALTTITSTAAAIVTGRAGQNLAGAAAVLSSTNNSINQEMYSGILMPAITREIRETRKALYEKIIERQTEEIEIYPHALAMVDAIAYHNLCSIPFALVGLVNKAEPSSKRGIDNNTALLSIDNEIGRIKNLLNDKSFNFSPAQKASLSKQIFELSKHRNTLVTLFALPKTTISKPAQTPTTEEGETSPQTKQPFTSPLSIPGIDIQE